MIRAVDLSTGAVREQAVDEQIVVSYLGGLGLAVRLMADWPAALRPGDAPLDLRQPALSPSLPLFVAVGSLNGTGFPGANRACFFGVSPLTGVCAGSWLGGDFSTALARSGTTVLVLEGRAAVPSIVLIESGGLKVIPRGDLWGKTTAESQAILAREWGSHGSAVIGPAGERLVSLACIRGNEGHVAGRCGLGAVLGSKNVKAIVAGGDRKARAADRDGLKSASRKALQAIRESEFLNEVQGPIGTPSLTKMVNEFEALPTANFQKRFFPAAPLLYGERINEEFVYKRTTCPSCPVRCRAHVLIDGELLEGPEYETICLFGSNNQVDDYPLIVRANALCNDLGLDTISAGNIVAFYREHEGTLADSSGIIELIRAIGHRQGIGDLLASGARNAAQVFDVEYAMHVKGLELAGYDPRKLTGMAMSYCTANRGGCHSRSWTVADEVANPHRSALDLAELVVKYHDLGCVKDSLITCTFLDGDVRPYYSDALSAVLGIAVSDGDLRLAGERIYTLERVLNCRRGITAADDVLPRRLVDGLLEPDKYREGMSIYYRLRDWDRDGRPRPRKLEALDLGFMLGGSSES